MDELLKAKQELTDELAKAEAADHSAYLEAEVEEFRAKRDKELSAEKDETIANIKADIAALDRVIARVELQKIAADIPDEPVEEIPPTEAPADQPAEQ